MTDPNQAPAAELLRQAGSIRSLARALLGDADAALEAARSGAKTGTVWVTREQTSGRGRRGNTWTAAAGECLTLSILVHYQGDPERLMGLSLVIGLALRDAVHLEAVETNRPWIVVQLDVASE